MANCYIGGKIRFKGRLVRVYAHRCSFGGDNFTVIKGKPLAFSEKDRKKLIKRVYPKQCPGGKGSYCIDLDSMG